MISLLAAIWSLYFYSATYSIDSNVGDFESTSDASVYVLKGCDVTAKGINFCVHNASWSTQYGWSDTGGAVNATGKDVVLGTASQATGWLDLPIGKYDVTFNSSALTIRFDTVSSEDPDPDPVTPDPEPVAGSFLRGGDLTMATYIEDWGTKFYYKDGTQGDLFDILQEYGINLARLRLYNAPGTGVLNGSTTYRTPIMTTKYPSGYAYAGPEDILSLSKRAKNHDMAICLSIYLSDFWSGATEQYIPAAWQNVSDLNTLGDSVYNFVHAFMTRMVEQGTTPEYVSVGNESNYGILYQDLNKNYVSFGGHTTRNGWSNAVYLFNRAYDAIKAVSPTSQVIIHHSYGDQGKIAICRSFFQSFKNNGGKFDIVGGSYYPHWATDHGASDCTPTGMLEWATDMKTYIGKPVMIMEVGYSWTQYRPSGRNGGNYEGQLGLNGAYNEATEDGQAAFMSDLHSAMATDANILGYMYWDPIFVDQYVSGSWIKTCWAEKYSGSGTTWWEDGNVISNTTLFDYTGKPLKALYSTIAAQAGTTTAIEQQKENTASQTVKVMRDGQLYILKAGKTYNTFGAEIK